MFAYGIVSERNVDKDENSFYIKNLPRFYVLESNCSEPIANGDLVFIAFDYDDLHIETEIATDYNYEGEEIGSYVVKGDKYIYPTKIKKITPEQFEHLQGLE